MNSFKRIAGAAGLGYLIIFATGFFANFYVLESLVDWNNAAATAANFAGNVQLLRYGLAAFTVMVLADLLLAQPLYALVKPVNASLARLSAWLRIANGTVFGIALASLLGAVRTSEAGTELPDTAQMLMQQLHAFNDAWTLGLVFFAIHLLLLGYLAFRAQYMPRLLGALLMLAGVGYLIDCFALLLLPNYEAHAALFETIVVLPAVVGELSLTGWLLAKALSHKPIAHFSTT